MIDWNNLPPLPMRRQKDATAREKLAAASHAKKRAAHKGRCHVANWARRQDAIARKTTAGVQRAKSGAAHARYRQQVRAFWAGDREDHPTAP